MEASRARLSVSVMSPPTLLLVPQGLSLLQSPLEAGDTKALRYSVSKVWALSTGQGPTLILGLQPVLGLWWYRLEGREAN